MKPETVRSTKTNKMKLTDFIKQPPRDWRDDAIKQTVITLNSVRELM